MTGSITIKQKDAFRVILDEMTTANESLRLKLATDGQAVKDTVLAAATTATADGKNLAPAYEPVIDALNTTVDSINKQATVASDAVSTAISDLTTLINGLTIIEDAGAAGVANK